MFQEGAKKAEFHLRGAARLGGWRREQGGGTAPEFSLAPACALNNTTGRGWKV